MKRALIILSIGVLAAAAGYCTLYYCGTRAHREIMSSPAPELTWLKKEFKLSDAEFDRVSKLHDGYLPRCEKFCQRIAAKNGQVRELITSNAAPTIIEQKLKEAAQLRVECQMHMLNHFTEVSRQMPPEQGKRYLEWVQARTLAPDIGMAEHHGDTPHAATH